MEYKNQFSIFVDKLVCVPRVECKVIFGGATLTPLSQLGIAPNNFPSEMGVSKNRHRRHITGLGGGSISANMTPPALCGYPQLQISRLHYFYNRCAKADFNL